MLIIFQSLINITSSTYLSNKNSNRSDFLTAWTSDEQDRYNVVKSSDRFRYYYYYKNKLPQEQKGEPKRKTRKDPTYRFLCFFVLKWSSRTDALEKYRLKHIKSRQKKNTTASDKTHICLIQTKQMNQSGTEPEK